MADLQVITKTLLSSVFCGGTLTLPGFGGGLFPTATVTVSTCPSGVFGPSGATDVVTVTTTVGTAACPAETGTGGLSCDYGYILCNGACVLADPTNCNSCEPCVSLGVDVLNAVSVCLAITDMNTNSCGFECDNFLFGDCDGNPANGCETTLIGLAIDSSIDNCGACGNTCSGANSLLTTCVLGVCTNVCNAGYGNCDAALLGLGDPGNGCETNLLTDANNCGICGNQCLSGGCVSGLCVGGSVSSATSSLQSTTLT